MNITFERRNLRQIIQYYGFPIILILVLIFLAVSTRNFFTLRNIMGLLHSSAPIMITASGLALVVMSGNIDISIGSITFLSSTIAAVLIVRLGVSPVLAVPLVFVTGAACGAVTGLIVTKLRMNPLIASMGMLFILRGFALRLTEGRVISLPDAFRNFGNLKIGFVYVDVIIAIIFIIFVHLLHTKTSFGRNIMAIGNDQKAAQTIGINTDRVLFFSFVLSGLFASIGGFFNAMQLGGVTLHMGQGLEFTGIAMIVVGGISLFGGEGSIIPGFILGVFTLNLIENGLNHLGASPYAYPFFRGGVIFVAMFADTLKARVRRRGTKTHEIGEITT